MGATAPAKVATPAEWIVSFLKGLGAPVTKNNVSNVGTWLANEQTTTANWQQNAGNPLGVQTPTALAAGKSGNVSVGLKQTVDNVLGGYPTIVKALRNNAPAPIFNSAVTNSPWNGSHYGGSSTFAAKGTAQKGNPTGWWGQWVEPIFNNPIFNNPIPLPGLTKLPGGATTPGGGVITNGFKALPGGSAVLSAGGAVSSAGGAVSSVGGFFRKITNPTNLKNTGIFVGGAAITITGLLILFSATKGKQVLEVAEGTM